MTLGFDVLVHDVIDAITTAPFLSANAWPLRVTATSPFDVFSVR